MKKKTLALLLTAIMAMSTVGQTTLIYASEFTDGEKIETVVEDEFSDSEEADIFKSGDVPVINDEESVPPGESLFENAYSVVMFNDYNGMTAEEIFNRWGDRGINWEGQQIGDTNDINEALELIKNHQNNSGGNGYYWIGVYEDAVMESVDIPSSVKGLVLEGSSWCTAQLSSLSVPEGSAVKIEEIRNTTKRLNISGKGNVTFYKCRFAQPVIAEDLEAFQCTFKDLECKDLDVKKIVSNYSNDAPYLAVTDRLKVDDLLSGHGRVAVKANAMLDIGMLNDNLDFRMEVRNGKIPEFHVRKKIEISKKNMGDYISKGSLELEYYDGVKAENANKYITKDWFDTDVTTSEYLDDVRAEISQVKTPLMYVTEDIAYNTDWEHINFYLKDPKCTDTYERLIAADDTISVGKIYLMHEKKDFLEEPEKTPLYFIAEGIASLLDAEIEPVKDQIYAGKPLTPSVKLTVKGETLRKGVDYTVSYKNNTKPGTTATITFVGKGNYEDTVSMDFNILAVPTRNKVYTVGNMKYKVLKSHYKAGEVGLYSVTDKAVTSLSIPTSVKINGYTFKVTRIGSNACKGCTKLSKVTIGKALTGIGQNAFYGCKSLKSISVNSSVLKTVDKNAFRGIYSRATIKVPASRLTAYTKLLKGKGQSSSVRIIK